MRQWLRRFHRRSDEEFAAEVDAHLAHETDEQIDRGVPPDEARRAALRRFGNVTRHLERFREASPWFWLETVWQDVRYGWRSLRRSPALLIGAVLPLGLGIAGTTVVASLIDESVFRPFPYPRSDRLAMLAWPDSTRPGHVAPAWVKTGDVAEFTGLPGVFERAAAFNAASVIVNGDEQPALTLGIDCHFFEVLGVKARLGRTPTRQDCAPSAARVVVLSHELWTDRFGSDRAIVGRTIRQRSHNTQDNRAFALDLTVIGVMPPRISIWRERAWVPTNFAAGGPPFCVVLGRLQQDLDLTRAEAGIATVVSRLASSSPGQTDPGAPSRLTLASLRTLAVQDYEFTMFAVAGGAICVMLLVALNVGTMLLARSLSRQRELAVRLSLGAGRGRLVRQLLAESLVVAAGGGMIGVLSAAIAMPHAARLLLSAERLAPQVDLRFGSGGLVAVLLITIGSAFVLTVAPALHVLRSDPSRALVTGARATGGGRHRWRTVLVASQIALALPVFAATAALVRLVVTLETTADRYAPDHLLGIWLNGTVLGSDRYSSIERSRQMWRDLERAIAAVPGIAGTARTFPPLLSRTALATVRRPGEDVSTHPNVQMRFVSRTFFSIAGIRLLQGRLFEVPDEQTDRRTAIVSRSFATWYFGSQEAINAKFQVTRGPESLERAYDKPFEIVGVVEDAHLPDANTGSPEPVPSLYVTDLWLTDGYREGLVRTRVPADSVLRDVRRAVASVDPELLSRVQVLRDEIDVSWRPWPRLLCGAALSFSALSLALLVLGFFGVLSYSIAQMRGKSASDSHLVQRQGELPGTS